MKTVPIQSETVDMETGETVRRETVRAHLMPPPPDSCETCGVKHDPSQPHNAQSLYYQYAFYGEHERWPTWKDAIAHCDDATRENWERELKQLGAWTEHIV
jgi:hypothetical protein